MNARFDPRDGEIAVLKDEIALLREQIAILKRSMMSDEALPCCLGLTQGEERILRALVSSSPSLLTAERLMNVLYIDRVNDWPSDNNIRVMMMRLRRKCEKHGVEISARHGFGYYLPADALAILRSLTEAEGHRHGLAEAVSTGAGVR